MTTLDYVCTCIGNLWINIVQMKHILLLAVALSDFKELQSMVLVI